MAAFAVLGARLRGRRVLLSSSPFPLSLRGLLILQVALFILEDREEVALRILLAPLLADFRAVNVREDSNVVTLIDDVALDAIWG